MQYDGNLPTTALCTTIGLALPHFRAVGSADRDVWSPDAAALPREDRFNAVR
jgi:hypothetical protein